MDGPTPSVSSTSRMLREKLKRRRNPSPAITATDETTNAKGQYLDWAFWEALRQMGEEIKTLPQHRRDGLAQIANESRMEVPEREAAYAERLSKGTQHTHKFPFVEGEYRAEFPKREDAADAEGNILDADEATD